MRFIDEIVDPKLKCQRVGHKRKTRRYSAYRKPEDRYYAVERESGLIEWCPRCGVQHGKTVEHVKGYTGYSMPSDMADTLNTKGWVEIT